ncbi:hypothetical protein [Bacillus sp. AK031]
MSIAGIIAIIFIVASVCFSGRKEYLKLSDDEKEKLKKDLRNPAAVMAGGIMPIGSALIFISIVFHSVSIRCIGFILMGLGMIIEGAELTKHTSRGVYLIVIGASGTLATGFFMTKAFW